MTGKSIYPSIKTFIPLVAQPVKTNVAAADIRIFRSNSFISALPSMDMGNDVSKDEDYFLPFLVAVRVLVNALSLSERR